MTVQNFPYKHSWIQKAISDNKHRWVQAPADCPSTLFSVTGTFLKRTFERYPLPPVLWQLASNQLAFFSLCLDLTNGESFYHWNHSNKALKACFPTLTRKECHFFMNHEPHFSLRESLNCVDNRQAFTIYLFESYIRAHNGDLGIPKILYDRGFYIRDNIVWNNAVLELIQWAIHQKVNTHQLNIILDWFWHKIGNTIKQINPLIFFKTWSLNHVLREVDVWHNEINEMELPDNSWEAHFQPWTLNEWTASEITSTKDLQLEGRKLVHCVASYYDLIAENKISIISFKQHNQHTLTVEVKLDGFNFLLGSLSLFGKSITQVCGYRNRQPSLEEKIIIQTWANQHNVLYL